MKYKKGDVVVYVKASSKLNGEAAKFWQKMIGKKVMIIDVKKSKEWDYIGKPELSWNKGLITNKNTILIDEDEIKKATKKEAELFEQQMVENEI